MRTLLVFLLALLSCHSEPNSGAQEPIRVRLGTFRIGVLPGQPPLTPEQVDAGAEPVGAHVTGLESPNNLVRPGQTGKSIGGRATEDTASIGIALADEGEGFWVVPVGPPDVTAPGELTWALSFDVALDLAPGFHTLLVAAIDGAGEAGTQSALRLCVQSSIPDNLNSCDPNRAPPAAVLSLTWDTSADLDLVLVTPSGKFVDPKHPSTDIAGEEEEEEEEDPPNGVFDRDGMANCSGTGSPAENLVFQTKPEQGHYFVLVNLFDACTTQATRFSLGLHLPQGDPAALEQVLRVDGEVLANLANGGSDIGTFVADFIID